MTNKEIANVFQQLGNIMELHGENPYKIRSYQNAYLTLRKLPKPLAEMEEAEISSIKGVGTAIAAKIGELLQTGSLATLEKYRAKTPEGVEEMLSIKGFGPKKIRVIWQELGVESIGELLYAVNENRLIELKGFGKKTQEDLKEKLEYFQRSRHQFHYATLESVAENWLSKARLALPEVAIAWVGAYARRGLTLDALECLVGMEGALNQLWEATNSTLVERSPTLCRIETQEGFPVRVYQCPPDQFGTKQFRYTGSSEFVNAFLKAYPEQDLEDQATEEGVFQLVGLPTVPPELREQAWGLELAQEGRLPTLLQTSDIKGVVHAHSTYSDGLNSLREMAEYCRDQGYAYLGITDHSQSAFYANGLKPERLWAQLAEIEQLNQELAPFRIFKGTESDILNDGSLDYEEDLLAALDFVIASVHSNLRMDEEKATQRIVRAVEHPCTTILGHPTGRLLLSRKGYPLDHKRVIDACAANRVAIELNANPYRLDLDWIWIPYALEKGVPILVNPDAHSTAGVHDIHYGVLAGRKGGLTAEACPNTYDIAGFEAFVKR